uniref:Uncharacterized protein n=1 Tax=Monodon monoceros TaxID=40151 RepID=A0A8C6FAH8_MONMO
TVVGSWEKEGSKNFVDWYSHYGKTVWRFLKKLKIELPYDLAIPLLGIYPEKTIIRKGTAPQCSLWGEG